MGSDATYMTPGLARWRRYTDGPLLLIAIASLPLLMLELARDRLPEGDRTFLELTNVFVLVAFAVDYIVELCLASNRGSFVRSEWTSAVIVITQALAIAPGLGAFGVMRVLRVAPALRGVVVVLRLLAVGGSVAREGRAVIRRKAATFALALAAFVWLTSAVAFTLAEDVGMGNGQADSFFDALWWSTCTITTVGYGDLYPVTGVGRLVATITMVVGVATFAVVTAKVAEFLVTDEPDAPVA